MNGKDKEEILVAIARLEEKNAHLEGYLFKELRPHIQDLCGKIEACVEKSEACYHKNLRWMIATLLAFCAAALGWTGVLLKGVI